jgi:hypothetical protein
LVERYAPADPERERQIQELGLMTLQSGALIIAVALWVAARLAVGDRPLFHAVVSVDWGIVCGLMVGVLLHCARYYDALVARRTRGRVALGAAHRWPRSSSDLDFVAQVLAAVAVVALV